MQESGPIRSELRCAELENTFDRTPDEEEELKFLKEYLRDKPRLDIDLMKRQGKYYQSGNTAPAIQALGLAPSTSPDAGTPRGDHPS